MRQCLLTALVFAGAACGPAENAEDTTPAKPPPIAFDVALIQEAAAKIGHGERLTWVLGCRGCHGKELQGERFYELYGSNLTRDVRGYSDQELERLLREGVRKDKRDMWAMPSELFQHLADTDMAALITYLRTLRPEGKPTQPPLAFEEETRQLIAQGKFKPTAAFVQEWKGKAPADLGPQFALGRYITMVTCAECHGPELKGNEGDTPDLIVVGGYSRVEFERLMTEGIPTGGRKLKPLMVGVSKNRFSRLTPSERDALYAYLNARAEQPQ
jgi:cytochrome c553